MNTSFISEERDDGRSPFPRSVDAAPIYLDWEDNEDDQELGVLFLEAEEEGSDDERSPPIGCQHIVYLKASEVRTD